MMVLFFDHMLKNCNRCALYSSQKDKKLEQNTHMRGHWQREKLHMFRHRPNEEGQMGYMNRAKYYYISVKVTE